jgi:hypothetical protein
MKASPTDKKSLLYSLKRFLGKVSEKVREYKEKGRIRIGCALTC